MYKKGDYVVCIDNSDNSTDLILGGIYCIESIDYIPSNKSYIIQLEGHGFYYGRRFISLELYRLNKLKKLMKCLK